MQIIKDLFDLSGKGAIVTGGAMGIGQAIAFRFSEAGAKVLIADIDFEGASRTVEKINTMGGSAQAIQADARSITDAAKVAKVAVDSFGSLDILVNNAGIYPLMPFMKIGEEMLQNVFDVNLKGPFLFSQAAADEMIKAGIGGKIINIASVDAFHPTGNTSHYNASKGGVVMLTKALALELAPHRILVNAVAPGSITTPGTDAIRNRTGRYADSERPQRGTDFAQRVPLGRMGEPDDIAKVVLFLASMAADYMTGTVLLVDGGFLLS